MSILKTGIHLSKRVLLLNGVLFAVFFIFYYIFSFRILPEIIGQSSDALSTSQIFFSLTIVGTMLSSGFLANKLMKMNVLLTSCAITSSVTFLLIFIPNQILVWTSVFLVGVSFGIGQLAFFTHFWNTTSPEERGRIGGLIGFATLPVYYIIDSLIVASGDFITMIILATMLSLAPLLALSIRHKKAVADIAKEGSYPERKTILYYAIPWIIFSLVNATFAKNIADGTSQVISASLYESLVVLQTIAALFGALIAGFIADFTGRRAALASSVTLYGISMALRGFIQDEPFFYAAFVAEGLAWGILLTLYSFVIWGDLSNKRTSTKIYSIGLMTFYLAAAIGRLNTPLTEISVVASAFAGCSLIFLSNLPIMAAPELLSSDFRDKIKMKMHIKTLKKTAKKYQTYG